MKNILKNLIGSISVLMLILVLMNCKKENTAPAKAPLNFNEASDVNKFVYNGLKNYYLWMDQIPNLTASKFSVKDSLNSFLNTYSDPNKLFTDLLYKYQTIDKWSFLVDDSKVIDDWIHGISETAGIDFMLSRIGTSDNVFGFVRYVFKGSPAEKAGIKRGDFFMKVDDQQLTISNYQTLLFTKVTYKLSFANISSNVISLNGKTATLTSIKMQENPIRLDTVLTVNNTKVGYLVYNAFNALYDIPLNDVFKRFKDAGISRLVLDLRYNGGGSVQSAKYLASMIYGTATSKVFLKSKYNSTYQAYMVGNYGAAILNENFPDKIAKTDSAAEAPINTVNLSKLYVLTSDNTASASELLINGLKPYMQVFNIGTNSAGKYTASFTIKDWIDNLGNVNPNTKNWAMQPIVVKIANAYGVTDFISGLMPDYTAQEDIVNLLPFGNPNETLLKVALDDIQGIPLKSAKLKSAALGLQKVYDTQEHRPFAKQMYVNALPSVGK